MEPLDQDSAEGLAKEAERGRSARTPFITLVAVTAGIGILVGVVVGLVFLAQAGS